MSNPSPLRTHAPNSSFIQENALPSGIIYLKAEISALIPVRFYISGVVLVEGEEDFQVM